MNKFLVFLSIVVYVECNGYGLIPSSIGSTSGYGYGSSLPLQLYQPQQQLYQQQVYQPKQQIVEVQNEDTPIKVLFRARSPKIQVEQINVPGDKPTVQRTRTEEEPHRVEHEVYRPVIQEIREIIQPYRRVVQEIQPVIEQVTTAVARGEGRADNVAAPQQLSLGAQQLSLGNQQLLLNNDQSQYNTATLGDLQSAQLANIGYEAARAPIWLNSKELSRSRSYQ
jgi:hypothetical protein